MDFDTEIIIYDYWLRRAKGSCPQNNYFSLSPLHSVFKISHDFVIFF